MKAFNLLTGPLEREPGTPAGRQFSWVSLGNSLGARLTGFGVYDLPPGQKAWPYHYELQHEELLIVVAGSPTLRTPAGEERLQAGDVVAHPVGQAGGHELRNDTDEVVRLAIGSTQVVGSFGYVRPESGKLSVRDGDRERIVGTEPQLGVWDGEP